MKLRISGNTLRMRLSQSEVEILGKKGNVKDVIRFPGNRDMVYEIKSDPTQQINCLFDGRLISVLVPQNTVNEWVKSENVGIDGVIDLENNSKLSILVEKDFKCLTKRPNEDESDLYPNPLESH